MDMNFGVKLTKGSVNVSAIPELKKEAIKRPLAEVWLGCAGDEVILSSVNTAGQ